MYATSADIDIIHSVYFILGNGYLLFHFFRANNKHLQLYLGAAAENNLFRKIV